VQKATVKRPLKSTVVGASQ